MNNWCYIIPNGREVVKQNTSKPYSFQLKEELDKLLK